jgi:hypothetical protein
MFVPSQNGYVLSRADAKRILAEGGKGGGGGTVNYFTLNMPTSNNPADVAMAFDMLRAYGS